MLAVRLTEMTQAKTPSLPPHSSQVLTTEGCASALGHLALLPQLVHQSLQSA